MPKRSKKYQKRFENNEKSFSLVSNPPIPLRLFDINDENFNKIKQKPKTKAKPCQIIVGFIIFIALMAIFASIGVLLGFLLPKKCRYGSHEFKCIECGVLSSGRVLSNGQETTTKSWPYIALIKIDYTVLVNDVYYNKTKNCTGVLINKNTILSSANCFEETFEAFESDSVKLKDTIIIAYLGLTDTNDLKSGVKNQVKSLKIHHGYDSNTRLNDIALVKLTNKVDLNDNVQVSCLPPLNVENYPNNSIESLFEINFGNENSFKSTYLSADNLTLFDNCNGDMKNRICAGKTQEPFNYCNYDSSGALFVRDNHDNRRFVLVGLTSDVKKCSIEMFKLYTKVSIFNEWISQNSD